MTEVSSTGAGEPENQLERNQAFGLRLARHQTTPTPAPVTSADGSHPLSSMQERLWLDAQLQGRTTLDRPVLVHIAGPLDVVALRQAVTALVERHESLRCTFNAVGGVIGQRVGLAVGVCLTINDSVVSLGEITADRRATAIESVVTGLCAVEVDLAQTAPFLATLLVLGNDDHLLVLAMHHIVVDGWSEVVLRRDLTELYLSARDSCLPLLPVLPVRFVDWTTAVSRQRPHHQRSGLSYWEHELDAVADQLPINILTSRTDAQPLRHTTLTPTHVSALRALASRNDTTLFTVLLAALHIAVAAHTGSADVVIGIPVSGRDRSELDNVVGCFINVLALRAGIRATDTFAELLSQVRTRVFGALDHQHVPIGRIEAALRRPGHRRPLFNVRFQLRNYPDDRVIAGRPFFGEWDPPAALYNAVVSIDAKERPMGAVELGVTGGDGATSGAALIRSQMAVLALVATRPHVCIGELIQAALSDSSPPLDPTTPLLQSVTHTLLESFAAQVHDGPQRIAVRGPVGELTYEQLDHRRSCIAGALVSNGVKSGDVVAVYGNRCAGLVAALLGVLSAGGVMCPVDPAMPALQVQRYLDESGACHVVDLTDGSVRFDLPTLHVNSADGHCCMPVYDVSLPMVVGSDAAYVFFTSGSTGIPKAIVGVHSSLAQFLQWQASTFAIIPTDVVAFMSAVTFDPMLRNVFLPLVTGASIAIPPEPQVPHETLQWLADSGATVVNLTPSVADFLLSIAQGPIVGGALRWTCFSGEILHSATVLRWRASLDRPGRIVNMYGPTETTLIRCCHLVADIPTPGVQPVGWAIPGSQALVVRSDGALCQAEEPGEVWLRTAYGTLGYLNAPSEQALRFIHNPFSDSSEGDATREDASPEGASKDIVYRTGDVGWLRPDGALVVCGRIDDQIKIRGVRIEPGEVSAHLSQHPQVERCAVVAEVDTDGQPRLAAYVVALTQVQPAQLRRWLAERLTPPLVPAKIVLVPELTLNRNGKLDLNALRTMHTYDAHAKEQDSGQDLEAHVTAIWRELFRVEHIAADDDFFELGGHSLLAIQLFHHIERRVGIRLELHVIFDHPTVAQLVALIRLTTSSNLPNPHTVQSDADADAEADAIAYLAPVEHQPVRRYRLAPVQEVLWWLHQLNPRLGGGPIMSSSRLRGPLDIEVLAHALDAYVARHHTQRARLDPDEPMMVVDPPAPARLLLVDCRRDSEDDRIIEVQRQRMRLHHEELDLFGGPVTRFVLVQLGEDDHALFFASQHQFADGTSAGIRRHEVSELYQAELEHRPPNLPTLPLTYGDYAEIQAAHRDAGDFDAQLNYWAQELSGDLPVLRLPGAHPRPVVPTGNTHHVARQLDGEFIAAVERAAAQHSTTPMRLTMAAYAAFLHRLTGQHDVIVGFPVADRSVPGSELLVGMFANRSAVRFTVDVDAGFGDLVAEADRGVAGATRNRSVPFEQLVQRLRVPIDASRSAIFQTMFQWTRRKVSEYHFPGVSSVTTAEPAGDTVYDITVDMVRNDVGDGSVRLALNADLYGAPMAEMYMDAFISVLAQIVAAPHTTLEALFVSIPLESREVTSEVADHQQSPLDTDLVTVGAAVEPVHRSIRRHALEHPDRVALEDDSGAMTYGALDVLANQIAATLVTNGVKRRELVGVAIHQSSLLIATLLGVHRAGAAYVHLDSSLPASRRQFIVDDARLRVVVVANDAYANQNAEQNAEQNDEQNDEQSEEWNSVRCIDVCAPLAPVSLHDCSLMDPTAPAYVIYTSGSTGSPKGVVIAHGALASFVHCASRRYGITATDRVLQFHSPSFDSSVEEIFVALCTGATLVVRGPQTLGSTRWFLDEVDKQGVTVLDLPTSFWHTLVRDLSAGRITWPSAVTLVIIGGEAARPEMVSAWTTAIGSRCRLMNSYGPTESTVVTVVADLTGRSFDVDQPVPIGYPLEGVVAVLLDESGDPVAPGDIGELHLGGPTLATGYLGQADLTAQHFRPQPAVSGRRMYATGDRAATTANGELVFHGRIDDQVKVRGHRVELAEVERLLAEVHGVDEVAVLAERRHDTLVLVAHVTVSIPLVSGGELLSRARSLLPDYLLPAAIIVHPTLPRTAGAKVDRVALRMAKVKEAQPQEMHSALPLSPYQVGLWLDHQLSPDANTNLLSFVRRLTGPLDVTALNRAITAVVHRHDSLRSRMELHQGAPRQVIDNPRAYEIESVDLCIGNQAEEREQLAAQVIRARTTAPFDLAHQHPWRAVLVRISSDVHLMAMVFHHIAVDGWSMRVVQRELSRAYAAYCKGHEVEFDALELSYADAVTDLHQRMATPAHATNLQWWVNHLGAERSVPSFISTHTPRSNVATAPGEIVVSTNLAKPWLNRSREMKTTPFVVGLALVAASLHELGGDRHVVIGTPVADRDRTGSEHLVGMFVNLTPMSIAVPPRSSLRDLVAHARQVMAQTLEHRGVTFQAIVGAVQPVRMAGRNPLLDVTFQVVGATTESFELLGVTTQNVPIEERAPQVGLAVRASFVEDRVDIACRYNPTVIDADATRRFAETMAAAATLLLAEPDIALASPLPVSAPQRNTATTNTLAVIVGLLQDLLATDAVGPDDDFFDLGGHSLLAIRLLSDVEATTGVALPLSSLLEHPSARGLASLIDGERPPNESSLLVQMGSPTTTSAPLYCVHPAGGQVFVYERLTRRLGSDHPVVGIRERGYDGVQRTADSISAMATDYLDEIVASGARPPVMLAGYSTGGLVAFEMACQLADRGTAPELLVLFDTMYRTAVPVHPLIRASRDYLEKARHGGRQAVITRFWESVAWAGAVRVNQRRWDAAILAGKPADPKVAEHMSNVRNQRLAATFPARPYGGRVLYVRATGLNGGGAFDKGATATKSSVSIGNWAALCSGSFEVIGAPGTHEGPQSLFAEPFVGELADKLRSYLLTTRTR